MNRVKKRPARLAATLGMIGSIATSGIVVAGPASAAPPDRTTDSEAPVLWAGEIRSLAGSPAAGTVTAFIRPPADGAPSTSTGTPLEPILLDEVAVGPDGQFQMRATMPQAVPRSYVKNGNVNVMLFVVGEGGNWAVATDTLHWMPRGNGTWFSSVASLERADERARSAKDAAAADRAVSEVQAEDAADVGETRTILLAEAPPEGSGTEGGAEEFTASAVAPGSPYVGCALMYRESSGSGYRTASQLDIGRDWGWSFRYSQTSNSAWQVGYAASGSSTWKVAGSVTFSKSVTTGINTSISPITSDYKRDTYQVNLTHDKLRWQCGTSTNPGPYYVNTVEARTWDGQTRNTGSGQDIGCNSDYKFSVAGRTEFYRDVGSSATTELSASVFGFTGKQTVSEASNSRMSWTNGRGESRYLCGETGSVTRGRSRVEAIA